jgi:hypothetical protein
MAKFAQVVILLMLITGLTTTACSPRFLPGTDIQDTPANHEILSVIANYRDAMVNRNADAIMKLVSGSFFDSSGGPEATYDYLGLSEKTKEWAQVTKRVRLNIQVKSIAIEGDQAKAKYFYDLDYQVPGPENTLIWKHDSDTKEMSLLYEGKQWKITSGI